MTFDATNLVTDHVHDWQEWTSADGTGMKLLICSLCPATQPVVDAPSVRDRITKVVVELHHGSKLDPARFGRSWKCEWCSKAIGDLEAISNLSWLVPK